jgi:hypothetical protein
LLPVGPSQPANTGSATTLTGTNADTSGSQFILANQTTGILAFDYAPI